MSDYTKKGWKEQIKESAGKKERSMSYRTGSLENKTKNEQKDK